NVRIAEPWRRGGATGRPPGARWQGSASDVINLTVTMDMVQIGGLEVAFERKGDGPALVLLHGGVSDSRGWRRQLENLSDGFTVVAWDGPGCGRSSDPPGRFLMPDYADCLAGLIDALGLVRPHIAGLSFGGTLAIELWRRHPGTPRTLVLASAYTGWAGSLPP